MKKGKFGIVLCFYPIAAFAAAILDAPLIGAILAAAAIFAERDEWAGRQTLQAWMLSVVMSFFSGVAGWVGNVPVPFLGAALSVTTTVLYVVVYFCGLVLSILGISRVMRDGEANIPVLCDIAYRVYGKRRPKPTVTQIPPAGYPGAYQYPQEQPPQAPPAYSVPPYAQPHPAPQPMQQPPQPPQGYAPPMYTPPVDTASAQPQGPDQSGSGPA